jgi:hypothetical protein
MIKWIRTIFIKTKEDNTGFYETGGSIPKNNIKKHE